MSVSDSRAVVHVLPLLRRKSPDEPAELSPVPPLPVGTRPREMLGVVVGFVTVIGPLPLTCVTVPPLVSSPFCATMVQSAPSFGATFVFPRFALHDEPW